MTLKQKKELRERQSTRQLMGIGQLTDHGVKTPQGELAFFLVQPDNLSVLSPEGIRSRVTVLANLLRSTEKVRLLALDSRESFQRNKDWYGARMEAEELPAVRRLLQQDAEYLDEIQLTTASAREFVLVFPVEPNASPGYLTQMEKGLRDVGFRARLAEEQDVKRLLAVYYQQDVTTERFPDFDGEECLSANA